MSKNSKKPVFKAYNSDQLSLLPPSLEELIPSNHVVRIVRQVIDQIDIDPIIKKYKGGGCSSFHPRLMLKIVIFGYLSNIYSSRKLEQAVMSNIYFMWLAGMQRPDHNTINRFRSDKLKGVLKEVFGQVVLLMADQGLVDIKTIYTDGTKMEANANKYTFVWGKTIKRNKARIKKQLGELWSYAEQVAKEELMDNDPTTYTDIDAQQVSKTIASINEALKDKPVDKKVKQKLNYARKNWPKNLDKYKTQERILGDRNSLSKTDPDATFMRMKDDHMRNGQLKAAYNWQISTSDQYIINYDIFQNPTDFLTFPKHLDEYQKLYGQTPDVVVADAGYGSEENYEYLEKAGIEGFVKYPGFHKEQKAKGKIKPKEAFHLTHLYYNEQGDYFICPMGQKMEKCYETKTIKKSGYIQIASVYRARSCKGCPLRGACHKSKEERTIQLNHNLKKHRQQAKSKLLSDQGIAHRSQRPADVEAVFGNIKQNKKFTRFMLRGKQKVLIEVGLLALAHNLAKMAKYGAEKLLYHFQNAASFARQLIYLFSPPVSLCNAAR
jgi:transposase